MIFEVIAKFVVGSFNSRTFYVNVTLVLPVSYSPLPFSQLFFEYIDCVLIASIQNRLVGKVY